MRNRAAAAPEGDPKIRAYRAEDAALLGRLFYDTVHALSRADYTPEQLHAWAPEVPDAEAWHTRLSRRRTLVVEEHGEPIAFAALEGAGHLDLFYVHKDAVRRGIGTRLYEAVEQEAREMGIWWIHTEASITARPFFERHGFQVREARSIIRSGVELANYAMDKTLK